MAAGTPVLEAKHGRGSITLQMRASVQVDSLLPVPGTDGTLGLPYKGHSFWEMGHLRSKESQNIMGSQYLAWA